MFKTKSKAITDILNGLQIDLHEAQKFTNFKESDIHPINLNADAVKVGIDNISFRNIDTKCTPYIAPTISPGPVSILPDYLEHPQDIFDRYIEQGQTKIIGEMKHMGSNATIIVYKDEATALSYTGERKTCYVFSRNGFNFFNTKESEEAFTSKLMKILEEVNYFNLFGIKMAIWGTEILPWNLKASGLLNREYMPALNLSKDLYSTLDKTFEENPDVPVREELKKYTKRTLSNIDKYHEQLKDYCKQVDSIDDVKVAPYHLLATDKGTCFKETHKAQLEHFGKIISLTKSDFIIPTEYIEVDLTSRESMDEAIRWWEEITSHGYEGAIFKTWHFTEPNAIPMYKCRGKDYLRIIYGINYDMPDQIAKHKTRRISKKIKMHMAETLLSVLSLESFLNKTDNHDYMLALVALSSDDGLDIRL